MNIWSTETNIFIKWIFQVQVDDAQRVDSKTVIPLNKTKIIRNEKPPSETERRTEVPSIQSERRERYLRIIAHVGIRTGRSGEMAAPLLAVDPIPAKLEKAEQELEAARQGSVSIDYSEETSLYNSATVYQSNVLITTERK